MCVYARHSLFTMRSSRIKRESSVSKELIPVRRNKCRQCDVTGANDNAVRILFNSLCGSKCLACIHFSFGVRQQQQQQVCVQKLSILLRIHEVNRIAVGILFGIYSHAFTPIRFSLEEAFIQLATDGLTSIAPCHCNGRMCVYFIQSGFFL